MDVLLGVAALVVLISVPTLLGLIYLELRQRRMFGPRSIITNERANNDTAAIAMSLQAELERLRSSVAAVQLRVGVEVDAVDAAKAVGGWQSSGDYLTAAAAARQGRGLRNPRPGPDVRAARRV